jgi:hypothetical protein
VLVDVLGQGRDAHWSSHIQDDQSKVGKEREKDQREVQKERSTNNLATQARMVRGHDFQQLSDE